jgi:phosphohistidine phosphatase
MKLWILRHARAEASSASGRDRDRELAAAGWRACRNLKRWLKDNDIDPPGHVLVSPAKRTRQTAEAVFGTLGGPAPQLQEELWLASVPALARLIQGVANEVDGGLALIGHNPGLEDLLRHLGADLPMIGLKPGTLVMLEVELPLAAGRARTVQLVEANESV